MSRVSNRRYDMKVRIKENSYFARLAAWKLGASTMAITLGSTIHLHNTKREDFLSNQSWVCHELAHVRQFRHYGYYFFLLRYLWESFRKGYYNNRWEIEARAAEKDISLLERTEFC